MEETIRSMQMMANKYMDDFEEDLGSVPEGLRPLVKLGLMDLVEKESIAHIYALLGENEFSDDAAKLVAIAMTHIRRDMVDVARLALLEDGEEPERGKQN